MDTNYKLDKFLERVEDIASKMSAERYDNGDKPFARDTLFPAKPIRHYLAFMNPTPDFISSLLKTKPKDVALALLNNEDDLDALVAVTKLF